LTKCLSNDIDMEILIQTSVCVLGPMGCLPITRGSIVVLLINGNGLCATIIMELMIAARKVAPDLQLEYGMAVACTGNSCHVLVGSAAASLPTVCVGKPLHAEVIKVGLKSYNGSFINITFPALKNMQRALNEANEDEATLVPNVVAK
jgi:hypothetical protein